MLEVAGQWLGDALSARWFLQIALLSVGLTLACQWGFREDARSRRSLGVAAIWLLVLIPVLLLVSQPRYQIGVVNPPALPDLPAIPVLLLLLWIGFAGWGVLRLVHACVGVSRTLRELPVLANAQASELSASFCARLGMVEPKIVVGERCCASTIGRAVLVVPDDFPGWPALAQKSVIAHELVHLNRRDDRFMLVLQALVRCYPFFPWLHALYQRFVCALEEACDERAAELVGSRALYLEGLAEAALRDSGSDQHSADEIAEPVQSHFAAALIDASHTSVFMQRLARLLGKQKFFEVQSGALAVGMGAGLLGLAVLTTFELVAVKPRVTLAVSSVPTERASSNLVLAGVRSKDSGVVEFEQADLAVRPEVQVIPTSSREERISPAVIYPGQALLDGVEGQVLIEYSIAADGSTARERVVRSTHPNYFNAAATRAVRQTVYTPNYKTGFSGVTAVSMRDRTGRLDLPAAPRVRKLFVFRINAPE